MDLKIKSDIIEKCFKAHVYNRVTAGKEPMSAYIYNWYFKPNIAREFLAEGLIQLTEEERKLLAIWRSE